MSWTEAKVKKLEELWGKGSTASQIAEIIGGMSRNAVIGKAHRLNLSSKVNNNISGKNLNSKKNNQEFQKTSKKGRRNKFRSLLIEKNFEPARNLTLEKLTEETCKYMEHDMHPNDPNATFCGRKTISNSKQKFSYCPLHLMIIFQPKSKKEEPATNAQNLKTIGKLLAEGKINPFISKTVPMKDAVSSIEDIAKRKVLGKVVFVND